MRCPDCQKFVSLEFDQEPEINNEEFDAEDGSYEIEIRIVRTCADCGQELKDATLNFDGEIDGWEDIKAAHEGDDHDILMEVSPQNDEYSKGKGRYMVSFFGASVDISIHCKCQNDVEGAEPLYSINVQDHVQASGMDELV